MTLPHPNNQSGFTLVESLAVLAIAGMLSVLLLGSFGFFSVAWRHATDKTDRSAEDYAAQSVLRRVTMGFTNATGGARVSGGAQTLSLTTRFALPGEAPTPIEASLAVEKRATDNQLVLTLTLPARPHAPPKKIRVPLISNIESVRIGFLSRSGEWLNAWHEAQGAPRLLRLEVRLASRDKNSWPALYLPLGAAS